MKKWFTIRIITAIVLILSAGSGYAEYKIPAHRKARLAQKIKEEYPEQLTDPAKKMRKTFSQFGYNLYEFSVPLFPVRKFITADKFGKQSYGKPNRRMEKNGAIYTCRGGFIDVSHMRAAIDWTVFLTFKIMAEGKDIELPWEAGDMSIRFSKLEQLSEKDVADMAQKIAFERLTWHEVASWHFHKPYHFIGEQHSTFTPEDNYSNLLGTVIGKRVALRMMNSDEHMSYSDVATDEIHKMIIELQPVASKRKSKDAYDMIDRHEQLKLPAEQRNKDVWYDSKIVMNDERYVFKRDMNIGPMLEPWLVPKQDQVGCACNMPAEVLSVPQVTETGHSFYDYYDFHIVPDSNMFYDYKAQKQLHPPIAAFSTREYPRIMEGIHKQMEDALMVGFDKRDMNDPTIFYTNVHTVFMK